LSVLAVARSSFATSLLRYRRSWGLWLLLLIAPVSARYWIAGKDGAYAAIVIDGKGPLLTSAILGVSLGIIVSTILLPIVFVYLRTNTTRRQPWQIEETTVASRIAIAVGRFGADAVVLGSLLAAMNLAGWLLAWVVEPVDGVRLADISLGLWLIAAPVLMGAAALRIAFDSLRITRRAPGEVLAFFLWLILFAISVASMKPDRTFTAALFDFYGFARPIAYTLPPGDHSVVIGRAPISAGRIALDAKGGLLSEGYSASRLSWMGLAVMLVALAGFVYRPHRSGQRFRPGGWVARLLAARPPAPALAGAPAAASARMPGLGVFFAEFKLIARGRIWLLLALLVAALGLISDFRRIAGPAAVLLLIFGLSAHAGRCEQTGLLALTRTMIVPPFLRRAMFVLAGTAWSVLLALPAMGKAALAGSFAPVAIAPAAGAIASLLAIVLAAWARSAVAPRLILLIVWYGWISAPQ
jgi:hypothetical protein